MSKYNYKITVHYLCGNEIEPCKREFRAIDFWPDTPDLEDMTTLSILTYEYDKVHKIGKESILNVDAKDIEVVVFRKRGGRSIMAVRLHRKKTPQTAIVLDV